jgi:hypothetical protein
MENKGILDVSTFAGNHTEEARAVDTVNRKVVEELVLGLEVVKLGKVD